MTKMKLKSHFKKGSLLLVLFSLTIIAFAQQPIAAKRDSATKAFLKDDSLRRNARRDTTQISFSNSVMTEVWQASNANGTQRQKLLMQLKNFAGKHYMTIIYRSGFQNNVTVFPGNLLQLRFQGGGLIDLHAITKSIPLGNGMRNSSDLKTEYALTDADFKALQINNIVSIRLDCGLNSLNFELTDSGTSSIRAIFLNDK